MGWESFLPSNMCLHTSPWAFLNVISDWFFSLALFCLVLYVTWRLTWACNSSIHFGFYLSLLFVFLCLSRALGFAISLEVESGSAKSDSLSSASGLLCNVAWLWCRIECECVRPAARPESSIAHLWDHCDWVKLLSCWDLKSLTKG